jgi:5-formyltetrahydrofolate cyclo-ligase
LELRLYSGRDSLRVGAYNILEPVGPVFSDYDSIDLAVVPGVAFTADGIRLGRGKGYYDRLLPRIKARKIGICFPFQILHSIPAESFDIRMDEVIC